MVSQSHDLPAQRARATSNSNTKESLMTVGEEDDNRVKWILSEAQVSGT